MRSRSLAGLVGLAALAAAGMACSNPQSFVVLLLESSTSAPITGVEQVQVVVSKTSGKTRTLTYAAQDLTIVPDASVTGMGTLSVSFSGDETGDVTFEVTAVGPPSCLRGRGTAIITLKKGAAVEGAVLLVPGPGCTGDGGAPGDGGGQVFPGCDPSRPVCSGGQTCQVNCTTKVNACTAGGTAPAWGACQSNADCAPGSQCFDYSSLGCNTKVCLRFCDDDTDCGGTTDAGGGPGSFCRDPVSCGGTATAYHTCSASCDPTGAAASSGRTGCPAGLACVLPAGMDHVACACPESTRTKPEGASCASTKECAPGLLCEQTCRAVCHCDLKNGACSAANDCPTAGTTCTPIAGEMLYGVCL